MRFLRFLRSNLSLKIPDWWGRWLDQAKDNNPESRSSNRLPFSAPLNRTEKGLSPRYLLGTYYYGERNAGVPGIL